MAERMHPKDEVAAACARWGAEATVDRAVAMLSGARDDELALALGGFSPPWLAKAANRYWPRVWGARLLLYAWRPSAAPAVVTGLGDEHWRVREMCAKVTLLRELGEAAEAAAGLASGAAADGTPRVRVAAVRALAVVGEAEHADALLEALDDPEPAVRTAAGRALLALERRLDRSLR